MIKYVKIMKIAIIIRTFNESRWIAYCLKALKTQHYKGQIQLIIVDSGSTDNTLDIAKRVDPDIVIIRPKESNYLPGKFINFGIAAADTDTNFVVILSAHCVPTSSKWLNTMVSSIRQDEKIAGVYCKQIPTRSTNYENKRDLVNVFGEETLIKHKDPFFHNAASIIRYCVLSEVPFDHTVKHIEDRIWSEKVHKLGYKTKYESGCSVIHEHGINQHSDDYNSLRGKGVAQLQTTSDKLNQLEMYLKKLTKMLVIPVNYNEKVISNVLMLLSDMDLDVDIGEPNYADYSLKELITHRLKEQMELNDNYYDFVLYINCSKYEKKDNLKELANFAIAKNADMSFYVEQIKNDYFIFNSLDEELIIRSEQVMERYENKEHVKLARYELGTFIRTNYLLNDITLGETIMFYVT